MIKTSLTTIKNKTNKMLFGRKNYSRRLEALKTLKAYLRTINLSDSDQIGEYTYRMIYESYKVLLDYPKSTRVYTIITSKIAETNLVCDNVDDDEPIPMKKLLEELKHTNSQREVPRLKKALNNPANADTYKKLMKDLDLVIEYYTVLSNASKNE